MASLKKKILFGKQVILGEHLRFLHDQRRQSEQMFPEQMGTVPTGWFDVDVDVQSWFSFEKMETSVKES